MHQRAPHDLFRSLVEGLPRDLRVLLADGIGEAHATAPAHWGVTPWRDGLRFNAGFAECLTIDADRVRLVVSGDLLPVSLPREVQVHSAGSRGVYRTARHSVILTFTRALASLRRSLILKLREPFLQNVRRAAARGLGKGVREGHRDALALAIADMTGRPRLVPDWERKERPHDEIDALEGSILRTLAQRRERSRGLAARKRDDVRRRTGALRCEACGLDPAERYGPDAAELCEVHHLRPLARRKAGTLTTLADLALLCPNCHRAIHRFDPLPKVAEFKQALNSP